MAMDEIIAISYDAICKPDGSGCYDRALDVLKDMAIEGALLHVFGVPPTDQFLKDVEYVVLHEEAYPSQKVGLYIGPEAIRPSQSLKSSDSDGDPRWWQSFGCALDLEGYEHHEFMVEDPSIWLATAIGIGVTPASWHHITREQSDERTVVRVMTDADRIALEWSSDISDEVFMAPDQVMPLINSITKVGLSCGFEDSPPRFVCAYASIVIQSQYPSWLGLIHSAASVVISVRQTLMPMIKGMSL